MALSANRTVQIRNIAAKQVGYITIETAAVMYDGAFAVAMDDGLSGYAAADNTTSVFLGLVYGAGGGETLPATGDGTKVMEYMTEIEVLVPTSGLTAGDRERVVYCLDDETVTGTNTAGPKCGIFKELSSTNVGWIRLTGSTEPAKAS